MEAWAHALRQLSIDMACPPEDFVRPGIHIYEWKHLPGRRRFTPPKLPLIFVACVDSLVISAHESLLPGLRADFLGLRVSDALSSKYLSALVQRIARKNCALVGPSLEYLPAGPVPMPPLDEALELHWYEEADINRTFFPNHAFSNAFSLKINRQRPDRLAVAAVRDGQVLGIAGASADSDEFYQIGVDVLPQARRMGIGARVVAELSRELQNRGYIPYYGTWPANIASQRVAMLAGFRPAWIEYYLQED